MFRVLFDYDPMCDAGLPGRGLDFRFGHILNVVGDDDADWWHAVRVVPDDGGSGVVPSKRRLLLDDCFFSRCVCLVRMLIILSELILVHVKLCSDSKVCFSLVFHVLLFIFFCIFIVCYPPFN